MKLEVFDPAMCCSTGVCGPSVDPALANFAADLDSLAADGASVRRYNLGQEPGAFAENDRVRQLLHEQGEAALPVVLADGELRSTGRYPTRDELQAWAGLASAPAALTPEVIAELAAIGAAVGSNCEPCFKFHYDQARKLGLSKADLVLAVRSAQMVKDAPAANMLDLAAKLLAVDAVDLGATPVAAADEPAAATTGGCCAPSTSATEAGAPAAAAPADAGCCGPAEPVTLSSAPATASKCC